MSNISQDPKNRKDILKVIIVFVFLVISIILTYYFQIILKTNIIYTHFFYIPVFLACIWWQKKGLIVPVILIGTLFVLPLSFGIKILMINNLENIIRAFSIIIISTIVAILSENSSKKAELDKAYSHVKFYKDLFTHDIGNILHIIHGNLELYSISKGLSDSKKKDENLIEIIKKQIERGMKAVQNIQKLGDLESSQISLQVIDLNKILNDVVLNIKSAQYKKNVEISVNSIENCNVIANLLLYDVFENILTNAIEYNDNTIKKIEIKIYKVQKRSDKYLKIEIMDNGIGISDEKKKIIFERGYKEEKGSRGLGFGLTLVKKIIESYKGELWVEDNLIDNCPKGSIFLFVIPLAIN